MIKTLSAILSILIVTHLSCFKLFAVNTPDVEAFYLCSMGDVQRTIVKDSNRDGVYDTYTVKWCNGDINTYPIYAIGDIRRWPPMGIPTRDIIQTNMDDRVFCERYFSFSGQVAVSWFTKIAGKDTVFFYDYDPQSQMMTGVDDYESRNITFKTLPNPAKDDVQISYKLKTSGWVTIVLYNEIGVIVDTIEESYKYQGDYNLVYSLSNLPSGHYFITVKLGIDEIFTKQLIIVK